MSDQKTSLEVMAPTVDEAIEKGLDQLGLPRNAVQVEVLDEGQGGFLGIGNRQVRVRLIFENQTQQQTIPENETENETDDEFPEEFEDEFEEAKFRAERIAKQLLKSMHVKAQITSRILEPEDEHDKPIVLVEITGNDLSILIGRKAETLNSLQYITSLILNQQMGSWIPLMIDVQGYRFRRERQLRQLARRMADQAVATGRKQVLEPMPANERRLIHLELRYHPFVTTESVGEEPARKATIFLKPKD